MKFYQVRRNCYVVIPEFTVGRVGHITYVVSELSGHEIGSKLELIEYLSTKGVGLGVAGNRSATCGEFHNGVIVALLVVDDLGKTTRRRDRLNGHLTLGIVVILDGIDDHLGGYDLAGESDIRLGSTDDSALLVFIIILLFSGNVNRSDNISFPIVDIEKLRTSK